MINKSKSVKGILGISVLSILIMYIFEGSGMAGYFQKSAIKIIMFLGLPVVYTLYDKNIKIKDNFRIRSKKNLVGSLVLGIGVYLVILTAYFILKDFIDLSNHIINLITDQKKLLIVKSKEGLYLPYKEYEINQSFMVLGIPILFIAALMVGTLLQKPIWITGIALFFYSIILFISLCFEKKRGSDFFETVIYFAIFGVSYLLIWVV